MANLVRAKFQAHPFHLVEPSPWPLVASFALLTLTVSGVMTMHGYAFGGYLATIGFLSVVGTMIFWFRDIIAEGENLKGNDYSNRSPISFYVPSLNSTICWNNFLIIRILKESQSAGNQRNHHIFSRILRDFTSSSLTLEEQVPVSQHNEFNSYLAGLFEGDGSIFIPKTNKSNPEVTFTFHKNNLPLYDKIKSITGFGYIVISNDLGRYRIRDLNGLFQFALRINGLLRTPKIEKFKLLTNWLTSKEKILTCSSLDNSSIGSNGWFCGFTF